METHHSHWNWTLASYLVFTSISRYYLFTYCRELIYIYVCASIGKGWKSTSRTYERHLYAWMENQSIFIILWFGVHNTFNSFHFTLVNDFVYLYYLFILRVNFLFRFQFQFERKYAFRCAHQLCREKMQIICGVLNLPFTFTEQPKLECLVWTFMFYCFFASFTDTFRFTNHKIISCHPVDTSMLILCCVNNDYNSNVI